jgi:TPR repeat protein
VIRFHHVAWLLASSLGLWVAGTGTPARAADDERAVLDAVSALEAQKDYAAMLERLRAFESEPTADTAFQIAWARYLLALDGKQPQVVDADAVRVAAEWAERARTLGSRAAPNLLYLIHGNGAGLPEDREKALSYLREGVAKGDAGAKSNYAVLLYRGAPGVPRDRDLAGRYLVELAREKVVVPAVQYTLGVMKFRGENGIRKDTKEAMRLIRLAAERGDRDAQRDLGKSFEFGWDGAEDLHQALAWYQRAADAGDGDAQWRIGMAFVNGDERDADPVRAVAWFRRAAASGSTQGMTSLAVMYATGEGVRQDWESARELYEEAAEGGEAHALLNLSGMYLRGEGVDVDPVHGFVLLSRAAQMGDEQAESLRPLVEKELTAEQRTEAERRLKEE